MGVLLLASIVSCGKDPVVGGYGNNNDPSGNDVNPYGITVATRAASAFGSNYFTAGGNVNCKDATLVKEAGLCYGTNQMPKYESDLVVLAGTNTGDFSVSVYNLSAGMKYYFRAYAVDKDNGVQYGDVLDVTTDNNSNPYNIYVTTYDYWDYGTYFFAAGGSVECDYPNMLKEVGLCYGVNSVPRYETDFFTYAATSTGDFYSYVYNLSAGTKYYYRACAVDKDNRVQYGSIFEVTTASRTGSY